MSLTRYRWAAPGDINAFFGLLLDNVMNLVILAGILIVVFKFPSGVVYTRMFPGTAFGVMLGDLIYTWLAFRLAARAGRDDVTAMPLGLDAPSTIGMAFTVLGPAFLAAKTRLPDHDAAIEAWQVGMACMVAMGLFKVGASFFGRTIQRIVPVAGLLGSIAGVGIALMGCLQLGDILAEPIVGLVSLCLIFYTLVARAHLPFRLPGVLGAVIAGAVLYYGLGSIGWLAHPLSVPHLTMTIGLPLPTLGFTHGVPAVMRQYLTIALPFALLTVIGGINNTESARLAGDDYDTRSILLTEAASTLVAGLCGGVSQTTPYIGHPAYKDMGARAAYTLATGLFVGLGGVLGYIPFMAMVLPIACLAPILVYVGLEIVSQAYAETPAAHRAAVTVAMLPSLAELVLITMVNAAPDLASTAIEPSRVMNALHLSASFTEQAAVFVMLGNGFIITGMIWGGALAFLIDRRAAASAACLACGAVLSIFGVIHSVLPTGALYWPSSAALMGSHWPWQWAAAYALSAILMLTLGRTTGFRERRVDLMAG